jgi:hypothetical protein
VGLSEIIGLGAIEILLYGYDFTKFQQLFPADLIGFSAFPAYI